MHCNLAHCRVEKKEKLGYISVTFCHEIRDCTNLISRVNLTRDTRYPISTVYDKESVKSLPQ